MPSSTPSPSPIQRLHRRVRALAALGILITALLAGLATVLPFYHASRTGLETITRISAEAHADALHHQLARFQDVASQLTSRTEIRRQLEAYTRGDISLAEVSAYTTPRLADAIGPAANLAGLMRLGPAGEIITSIGEVPERVELPKTPSDGYPCRLYLQEDGKVLVQACAPIRNDQGELIGRDLVFFQATPLLELLASSERLGPEVRMRLREGTGYFDLVPQATGPLLLPADDYPPGNARQVSFSIPLAHQEWQLLVEIPSRRFQGEALQLLLWPALTMLLLALGGALLVSRILHPLFARVVKQARQLELSERSLKQAASVFRHTREAILITNRDHAIIEANPAFSQLTGHTIAPLIGTPLTELLAHRDNLQTTIEAVQSQLMQEDAWQGEVQYRCANGDILVALQTISAVRDDQGKLLRYIHIFNDISEQKAAEMAIRHQALHDELTGLPNRAQLEQKLERAIRHALQHDQKLAVLFLDLDRFKEVNDTLGHQAGDDLLRQVAQRLRQQLREEDTLARLGGDEFVVVLEDIKRRENAARVAEAIIEALQTPFTVAGETAQIGVSVGIAYYPDDASHSINLIESADAAMYRAKAAGRNTWRAHARATS